MYVDTNLSQEVFSLYLHDFGFLRLRTRRSPHCVGLMMLLVLIERQPPGRCHV